MTSDSKIKCTPAFLGIALTLLGIILCLFYTKTLKNNFQNEIISSLKEVAFQERTLLRTEITGKQELLAEVAKRMSLYGEAHSKAVLTLMDTCRENNFKRMGIITPIGMTYATDKTTIDLSDRSYFQQGMAGKRSISDTLIDKEEGTEVNVYAVPIFNGEEVGGVLFATYATVEMQKQLNISSFGGEGYTYIVNREGDCIVGSSNPNSYRDMNNIFEAIGKLSSNNRKSIDQMKQNFETETEGCIKFQNNGFRYMYYVPIGINDWYLLTVAPAHVLDKKMNDVLYSTYLLGALLIAAFVILIVSLLRDQKKRKKEVTDILYLDKITGGHSYAKFLIEAENALKKQKPDSMSMVILDIDDFKFINELLGYEAGNQLIRYIHRVLSDWCGPEERYAHQTADQFVILVLGGEGEQLCLRLETLCQQLQAYSVKLQNKLQIIPSIGVFQIPDLSLPLDFCLDCAGIARKQIKGQFDRHYAFYDDKVKQQIYQDKSIEAEMRLALEHGEFIAYYQPQYDAATKQIVGAEALARWEHPDGQLRQPGQFIPLFEKNGFISELDCYMFRIVCLQQKKWLDLGYEPVPISVNISRKQLYDLNFIDRYSEILRETAISVKYVETEITESVLFDNQPRIAEVMELLHQVGYRIFLDDFGTGYSSMAMLKNLNFDVLKIDKSFIDNIGDERGNKIVEGIIRLADSIGLETVAEGVETREQYEYLNAHGCDIIQGYYFGKPMTADNFQNLLKMQ